jgi:glucosyl-3-phosphoglycerate synthase
MGGLLKMCADISKSLFRTLSSEGVNFSESIFNTLLVTYLKIAQDTIKMYEDDAAINGLIFDRHAEALAVETFARGIRIASRQFLEDPLGSQLIPNWSRVTSAIPDILDMLKDAVDKDNTHSSFVTASTERFSTTIHIHSTGASGPASAGQKYSSRNQYQQIPRE